LLSSPKKNFQSLSINKWYRLGLGFAVQLMAMHKKAKHATKICFNMAL